jgi:hypothetical protein
VQLALQLALQLCDSLAAGYKLKMALQISGFRGQKTKQ